MQKPLTEKESIQIFDALGHGLRLRIIHQILKNEELSVSEVMTRVGADKQPNVSQSLIKLEQAGLVVARYVGNEGERGNSRRYSINPDRAAFVKRYLTDIQFEEQQTPKS